ncbi:MAG: S8 family serine peptidase [Candidatus Berkelbacteria bacterium]|nr:S8 family serine peptidase [Candidatus Berkelbacteria bacterium]
MLASWNRATYIKIVVIIVVIALGVLGFLYFSGNFYKADVNMMVAEKSSKVNGLEMKNGMHLLAADEIAIINLGGAQNSSQPASVKEIRTDSGYIIPNSFLPSSAYSIMDGAKGQIYVKNDASTKVVSKSLLSLSDASTTTLVNQSKVDPAIKASDDAKTPVIITLSSGDPVYSSTNTQSQTSTNLNTFNAQKVSIDSLISDHGVVKSSLPVINGFSADIDKTALAKLSNDPKVAKIEQDEHVSASLDTSPTQIGADQVWQEVDQNNQSVTGKGVRIAIIDTGVDYTHPDLGGCLGSSCKVIGGYDFVNSDNDPMDDQGHGTHVAATAAGKGVLWGIAPDASILAYKVLAADSSGYESSIVAAIQATMDPNGDGNTADHADVASMSLGGSGDPDDAMSKAVDAASAVGVTFTIAAGNDGPDGGTIDSPGIARSAITVAATCSQAQIDAGVSYCKTKIASFSSRGPAFSLTGEDVKKPDIAAPGVKICAAQMGNAFAGEGEECIDSQHIRISGTSMATPHIAGIVALMKQADPSLTPAQIKEKMKSTATDLGLKYSIQGAGLVNASKAVGINAATASTPSIWRYTADSSAQIATGSQKFTVSVNDNTIKSLNASFDFVGSGTGITGTLDKAVLDFSASASNTLNLNLSLDNNVIQGNSRIGEINLKNGTNLVGVIYVPINTSPSMKLSLASLDFGVDSPSLSSWTSTVQKVTVSNLRTDIIAHVSVSSNFGSGIEIKTAISGTTTYQTSFDIPAGGSIDLDTSLSVADNSKISNQLYSGQITFTSQSGQASITGQFSKYYELKVNNKNTVQTYAYIYQKDSGTEFMAILPVGNSSVYLDTSGPYDIGIMKNDLTVPKETDYYDFREGYIVGTGPLVIDSAANSTHLLTLIHNDINNQPAALTSCMTEVDNKITGVDIGFIGVFTSGASSDYSQVYTSNLSNNYTYRRVCSNDQQSDASYSYYNEFADGIIGNLTQSNAPGDLKKITFHVSDLNLPTGTKVKSLLKGMTSVFTNEPAKEKTLPYDQIAYSNVPTHQTFGLFTQVVTTASSCATSLLDCKWIYNSAFVDVTSSEFIRSFYPHFSLLDGNIIGKFPDYSPLTAVPIENKTVNNGVGPYGFSGQFTNTGSSMLLDTVSGGGLAPFYQQDFGSMNYGQVPWQLTKANQKVVDGSFYENNLTGFIWPGYYNSNKLAIANGLSTGIYNFTAGPIHYQINQSDVTAGVTAKFDLSKSDPNPPAIQQLKFLTNDQRSETYTQDMNLDSAHQDKNVVQVMLDPVGGAIASVKANYAVDGTGTNAVEVMKGNNNLYSASLPAINATRLVTITLEANDDSGNQLAYSFDLPAKVTPLASPNPPTPNPDKVPPITAITAPVSGAYATGSVKISADASSANGSIDHVEFWAGTNLIGSVSAKPYAITIDSRAYPEGQISLTAKAFDANGLSTTSQPVAITIDRTIPTVTMVSPSNNSFVTGDMDVVAASGDNFAIGKVEFYQNYKLVSGLTAPNSGNNYVYHVVKSGLTGQSVNIQVKSYDKAGNVNDANSIYLNLGTTPVVELASPTSGSVQMGRFNISANAYDDKKISKVAIYLDKKLFYTMKNAPYTYSMNSLLYRTGNHTVYVKAYDSDNNTANSATASFKIQRDNVKPVVSIISPATDATLSGTNTVKISASDNVGVAKVSFYIYQKRFGLIYNRRLITTRTSAPYDINWNTKKLSNGTYYLEARASDARGNMKVSGAVKITIKN